VEKIGHFEICSTYQSKNLESPTTGASAHGEQTVGRTAVSALLLLLLGRLLRQLRARLTTATARRSSTDAVA